VGKEFSVEYHDALMQIPRSDVPHHTILEEVEKGYTLNDKVIRHAKVVVSSTPDESPTGTSGK
jgi:molecular chaperone GrpE